MFRLYFDAKDGEFSVIDIGLGYNLVQQKMNPGKRNSSVIGGSMRYIRPVGVISSAKYME